jgi:hypothetical protein
MHCVAGTHPLPLTEALTYGEHIFVSLLAEALPATRSRNKSVDGAREA